MADQSIHNTDELFPPLMPEEYASLRESVRRYGPRSAVLLDQHGRTIDGRSLRRACEELGLDYPREVQEFQSDLERLQVIMTLNTSRRRWNGKKRRALVAAYLKLDPAINDNHLGQIVGISQNTVAAVRAELEATFQIEKLAQRRGQDGKQRPAKYRRIIANTAREQEIAQEAVTQLPPSCNGKIVDVTTAGRLVCAQQEAGDRGQGHRAALQ